MKKIQHLITMLICAIMVGSFFSGSFVSATTSWTPDDKVAGWARVWGTDLLYNDDFVLLPIDSLRIDVWGKGGVDNPSAYVVTVAILNTTNILDAPNPPEIQAKIDEVIGKGISNDTTVKIDTIWKLLTLGANVLSLFEIVNYERLSSDEYYYLDDALVLWNDNVSLAIAKDENLALFAFSYNLDSQIWKDFKNNFENGAKALIGNLDSFVNQQFDEAGVVPTSNSEDTVDAYVLDVMDQLTSQYGSNDKSPSFMDSIPGYPVAFIGVFAILSIGFIIKKRNMR